MGILPFYARAAFLNAVETQLRREDDILLFRQSRKRILEFSSNVQNEHQMFATIVHAMDPCFIVEDQISPTELAVIERHEARICRAAELVQAMMERDLSAEIDAEQDDEPGNWPDHYAAFPSAQMTVILGGAI